MIACRLLPWSLGNGPENMAADETLLEAAERGILSLRFYGWSVPTVSLGYFQSRERLRLDPRVASLPWVRRATGGDALVHHHEITYCLAIPASIISRRVQPWVGHVHSAIARALSDLGVATNVQSVESRDEFEGLLCFQHFAVGDLMIRGKKILGSAQRRRREALLQHGGLLLKASQHAPMLPGIEELAGTSLVIDELAAMLPAYLVPDSWRLEKAAWTGMEEARRSQLASEKYSANWWNDQR